MSSQLRQNAREKSGLCGCGELRFLHTLDSLTPALPAPNWIKSEQVSATIECESCKEGIVVKKDTAVMALHNSAVLCRRVSPVPDESVTPADSGRPNVMHAAPRACSVRFGACLPIPVLDDRIHGAMSPTATRARCHSSVSACRSALMARVAVLPVHPWSMCVAQPTDSHANLVPLHELPVAGAAVVQAPAQNVGTLSLLHSVWGCGRGVDGYWVSHSAGMRNASGQKKENLKKITQYSKTTSEKQEKTEYSTYLKFPQIISPYLHLSVRNGRPVARSFVCLRIGLDWATLLAEKGREWLPKYGTSVRDKDSAIIE
ncbi:hypothetical protein DFH08DRAFT_802276 [Mycena albidolilacea]|uniref:Uncharacterized protein n=1 Tax=Mycena albidolilacea TaxID=1033008 RepID=A0AAD7EY36_9AGAR|nr:hypothetical protein DFH08DRAFT_802276 [Mycena albidolilacea]